MAASADLTLENPASAEPDAHAQHNGLLHHHFDDMDQQRETNTVGMWSFLVTEIMMFGGLFFAYTLYRWSYPAAYALGSHHLNWVLGTINTGVLLVSSLTMAMAVHSAALRDKKKLLIFLAITFVLGLSFLVIKYFEWSADYYEGLVPSLAWNYYARPEHAGELAKVLAAGITPNHMQMFFVIYFCMTGLHAIHMIIGLIMLLVFLVMGSKGAFTNGNDQPIEIGGLYWHLIDIIWVFLFPLLYLVGGIHAMGG